MDCIIFVTTFASITERVLPLIEQIKDKGEITIIVTTEQLEKFFKNNTDFKVIRTKVHPDLIDTKTKNKILSNIIRSKIEYRKLFKDIKNSEIYFSNKACAIVIFSYIKKLSKNNKVFFFESQLEKKSMTFPLEHSLRALVMRLIAKWILGIETVVHNRAGAPYWSLDERFFSNIKKTKIPRENKEETNKYTSNMNILKNKKILIAYNDSISCGFVEKTEFINKIDKLMDVLEEFAPGEYVIKPHPRINTLHGKMSKTKEVIPSYIPLQVLLAHDWKKVIGFDSGSLISAAENTDAEVISLMDAVVYINEEVRKKFRDNLVNNSKNKIKFLGKIEELSKILK